MQHYTRILAQHLAAEPDLGQEIDGEFIRLIFSASPLHDIGKLAIPRSILMKPGALSDQEHAIMRTHARIGAATLEGLLERFPGVRFLRVARDIAACHHERWDGNGYPEGLAGEDIPLAARIVAVADVYDALVSRRIYKPAMAHEAARETIAREAGLQFDPRVVDAFLDCGDLFDAVRARHGGLEAPRLAAS